MRKVYSERIQNAKKIYIRSDFDKLCAFSNLQVLYFSRVVLLFFSLRDLGGGGENIPGYYHYNSIGQILVQDLVVICVETVLILCPL